MKIDFVKSLLEILWCKKLFSDLEDGSDDKLQQCNTGSRVSKRAEIPEGFALSTGKGKTVEVERDSVSSVRFQYR